MRVKGQILMKKNDKLLHSLAESHVNAIQSNDVDGSSILEVFGIKYIHLNFVQNKEI